MSGIAAVLDLSGNQEPFGSEERVNRMIALLDSTGDDAIKTWSHKGIAVAWVNPNAVQTTRQVVNDDNSLFMWMKGELFDLEKERKRLLGSGLRLPKEDDAPSLCLRLYEEYGNDLFARLNGSFAIMIYDATRHELILVSDRAGSHPLYYACYGNRVLAATTARAVGSAASAESKRDLQAIIEFFTFQMVLGDRTYYENVRMVPPGKMLRFRAGNIDRTTYWQARFEPEHRPEAWYVEALADAFLSAVARRTEDDRRYGLLLSGGLDSRGILGSDKLGKITTTITLGDTRNREVRLAEKISAKAGRKHIFLQRDENYYFRIVKQAVDLADGTDRIDHAHFLGFGDALREQADVILNGWWLDDITKGLHLPLRTVGRGMFRIDTPQVESVCREDIYRVIMNGSIRHWRRDRIFAPSIRFKVEEHIRASLEPLIRNMDDYARSMANVGPYLYITSSAAKHHSALNTLSLRPFVIERTVALDNDLLDLYLSTPVEYKAAGRVFRKALILIAPELLSIRNANTLLRASASEWSVAISRLCQRNARALVRRLRPSRFDHIHTPRSWPDFNVLIRLNPRLQTLIHATINDEASLDPDVFDIAYANRVYQDHLAGKRNAQGLLLLYLTFGVWNRQYSS